MSPGMLRSDMSSFYYYFFDPGTQFPGNEKIRYAIQKKYKNQAGMNQYYYYYYHWIAIYVDENGHYGEYFDSLGRVPTCQG